MAVFCVTQQRSSLPIGVRAIGIHESSLQPIRRFERIHHRGIVRVGHSFEAMVFDDGEFIAFKGLFPRRDLAALFVHRKVGGEPAPPQPVHCICHGLVDMSGHSCSSSRKPPAPLRGVSYRRPCNQLPENRPVPLHKAPWLAGGKWKMRGVTTVRGWACEWAIILAWS